MKTQINWLVLLIFSFLVLLQGCEPKRSSFSPLQNGFGVVVHEIGIDSGPGAKLYYKGTNENPVLVWPCIGTAGYPILYTNDIALLLADKPDDQGRMGGGALIVVQGTGPAMDISDDVLKIAAEEAHVDFKKAWRECQVLQLHQIENALKVYYVAQRLRYTNMPDLEIQTTWNQVLAIMQDVKKTGKTNKVVNSDVLYLQKEYD